MTTISDFQEMSKKWVREEQEVRILECCVCNTVRGKNCVARVGQAPLCIKPWIRPPNATEMKENEKMLSNLEDA